jgi:L-alanine-DL-glutamate epimerase-like enolase superfamily enzyme
MQSNQTHIDDVQFFRATSPRSIPISDATHRISEISFVITRIRLASGVIGESYLLSFHYSPHAIAGALEDIRGMALGCDASRPGAFIRAYEREAEYFGHAGIHRWACGSINVAMWDAWGKTVGQPVWKLLGACNEGVPLYGSGGWLTYSIEELLDEVTRYVQRGFRAVKVKVGSADPEADIERLTKVREAVGAHVNVMMDANQGLDYSRALALAEAVRPLRITWFEEPLNHTDFDGYEQLRRRAGISIAMGEREFDTVALRELVRRNALDFWQPDLLRLGSVEAWRSAAAFAETCHIPVLPHYYKEYDVPLLMTIPNALGAESFDWIDELITHPIRMEGGFAYPNEGPGWGFCFKDEFLHPLA